MIHLPTCPVFDCQGVRRRHGTYDLR